MNYRFSRLFISCLRETKFKWQYDNILEALELPELLFATVDERDTSPRGVVNMHAICSLGEFNSDIRCRLKRPLEQRT